MATDPKLTAFLRQAKTKRDERDQARRAAEAKARADRRQWLASALAKIKMTLPDEVKQYASLNVAFEPYMIVLSIPGCHPIWITVEPSGQIVATVYPPLDTTLPVSAVPAIPFLLTDTDSILDAIAAAIVDQAQLQGSQGVTP